MNHELRFTAAADIDIATTLTWSEDHFGTAAAARYEALVTAVLDDISADPFGVGATARPELGDGTWSRHLRTSREHVQPARKRVKDPRHVIYYQTGDTVVVIRRMLHDSMEPSLHIDTADS